MYLENFVFKKKYSKFVKLLEDFVSSHIIYFSFRTDGLLWLSLQTKLRADKSSAKNQ